MPSSAYPWNPSLAERAGTVDAQPSYAAALSDMVASGYNRMSIPAGKYRMDRETDHHNIPIDLIGEGWNENAPLAVEAIFGILIRDR